MNRKFALFTVVIIFGFFWILIMNRDSVEAIEQTNKIITIKNIVKENIDENYIISRIRVEGNDVVRAITYSESKSVQFLNVYKSEIVKNTDVVGGNVVKRVFKQDRGIDFPKEVSFVIYNAYIYDEITTETQRFGGYRFIMK